jgi:biotin carboxyl carrier protein
MPSKRPGPRAYLLITLFAVALVALPFLFWYGTWFGRKLTDAEIETYLNDSSKPRHAQHALVQIGERMSRHDGRVRRWYPRIVELSSSPIVELRQTAAWIMGQDRTYAPFHEVLLKLVQDRQPMVRRNAALSLATFGDPAARPELRAMLQRQVVPSPVAGTVRFRLKSGDYVNPGTLIARIGSVEVRSPLPGEVEELKQRDGASVSAGDALIELSADKEHAWEALRALLLVGDDGDLNDVQRYIRGVPGMPDRVQQQARITAQAIRSRKDGR